MYIWIAHKGTPTRRFGRLWKFKATEVNEWVRRGGVAVSEQDGPDVIASMFCASRESREEEKEQ